MSPEPLAGQWYVSIECKHCSDRVILYLDLNGGKSVRYQIRQTISCPKCHKEGFYKPEHHQQLKPPKD